MHVVIIPSERYGCPDEPLAGIFQRDQAIALRQAGLRVGVVAPAARSLRHFGLGLRRGPRRMEMAEEDGIPVYRYQGWRWIPGRIPYLGNRFFLSLGQRIFARYVKDHGPPDLIHAHNALFAGALARAIRERWGIPYVLTAHSSAHLTGALRTWQREPVRAALAGASARLAVSRALGQALEQAFPDVAPSSEWEWVPNVLDQLFEKSVIPTEVRSAGSRPFTFLTIGALAPIKNQTALLRAYAKSFRGDPDAQLRVGGDGPLRATLEALSRELGISEQVAFLGLLSREQVLAEMQACDAFVLPSHHETFGVVLIEALACGKPVIATACGGPSDIVEERNGILIPPRDEPALAAAMCQMMQQIGEYDRVGIREECLNRFGKEAVGGRLLEVYRRVLAS